MMSRRSAVQRTAAALAAASGLAHRLDAAPEAATGLKGRVRHSACRWCYGKIPLEEFVKAAKEIGLAAIDLLTVEEIPVARQHGLTCAMVAGVPGGIARGLNRLENHDKIVAWFEQTAPRVAELGCRNMIVFSGNRAGLGDDEGLRNCATGIKRLLPVLEKHDVVAVMELLNSKVDHPGQQCDRTAFGAQVVRGVGSPALKLLYDGYHMQLMEGDLSRTIKAHFDLIGHVHTAGAPGRRDLDDRQEINWRGIAGLLDHLGYDQWVGHEFIPRGEPIAALSQAMALFDAPGGKA